MMKGGRFFDCILLVALSAGFGAKAQVPVQGHIFTVDGHTPVAGARVINLATYAVVLADDSGRFSLAAIPGDRLRFSSLGFEEKEQDAGVQRQMTVLLQRRINELPTVSVTANTYRHDSAQLRGEYGSYFNYHKPKAGEMVSAVPLGVGLNIDKLYEATRFKANNRKLRFRADLLNHEKDAYIDHVFSQATIQKIVPIPDDSIDLFLKQYRPSYDFLKTVTDYGLFAYIKSSYQAFVQSKPRKDTSGTIRRDVDGR